MPDWPELSLAQPPPMMVTTHGVYMDVFGCTSSFMNVAQAWQSANRAVFAPIVIQKTVTAYQMAIEVTTQSGNLDIGLYTIGGVRLVSTGSTAVAVAGVQVFNITDVVLTPGHYFAALNIDNTTAAIRAAAGSTTGAAMSGVRQQAVGAVTLPATATLAVASAAMWPYIVIATNPTTM